MKKMRMLQKIAGLMMSLAMVVTALNVNSACWYVMGQDELPKDSKKLRKF